MGHQKKKIKTRVRIRENVEPSELAIPKAKRPKFRLNWKAAAGLVVFVTLFVSGYLVFGKVQERRVRAQVVSESEAFEKAGQIDLAIRNLTRFLDLHPDDIPILEQLARLMADTARDVNESMSAIKVNDRLLRMDPDGPGRQETRRRLVVMYVRCGDAHRSSAVYRISPEEAANELRYRTAEGVARELLTRGDVGPHDHRLLAMALEGLAVPGGRKALDESVLEYQKALDGDPGDSITAERLARLCQERLNDVARGERILDTLAQAVPNSHEVRLVRYRYFLRNHRNDLARIDLDLATKLAPENVEVRLTAAGDALRRGDAPEARRHIAAIPQAMQQELRVRVIRGMVDFNEERPDEAIDGWRQGLLTIGGTDADLTWWLAHALLQMGRVSEARPLVAQYRRLSGEDTQPLYRFLQAELEERTGRPTRAILGLEWARDKIAESWQGMVQMALGRCYESLWDNPKALAAYRRATQLDSRQPEPRIAAARLLARKPDEAVLELERGLIQSPREPSLRLAMVSARLRQQAVRPPAQRNWSNFNQSLALALETSPTNSTLPLMKADQLALSGNLPGAVALLEQSTAKSPRNASLWTAWAEGLHRSGKTLDALKVLDRASAPEAGGDRAPIRITRARLLLALGRGRDARDALLVGEKNLPMSDRPLVWEALGRVDSARGDYLAARVSFTEWAKLLPDDPRPRLSLIDLAHASGDESAVRSTVEALRALGGPEDIAWRLCRAHEILWSRNAQGQTISHRDAKLEEANRLLDSVLIDAPEIPAAHLLRGEVLDKLYKPDEAISAYRRAWDRGSSQALPKLIEALIRRRKFEELASLRSKVDPVELDRLSAVASFRVGDFESSTLFARQAGENSKDSPGTRIWQARMYEAIGKTDQADATLRSIAEEKSSELEPWLVLIQSLALHNKSREISETIERVKTIIKVGDPNVLEARLRWAAGDRPAADRAFEIAMAKHRDDSDLHILASRYFEETGRPLAAASALTEVLRIDPKNRGASRQLAIVLSYDPVSWPKAATIFGTEAKADDTVEDRLARAMVLSRAPDIANRTQAITLLEALVNDLPAGSAFANISRNRLAWLLLDAGRAEEASRIALIPAETGADSAAIVFYIETLLRAKKLPEALRQLDRLASIKPNDSAEAALRVRWIVLSSKPEELAEALETAVRERGSKPGGEALTREAFSSLIALGLPAIDRAERVAQTALSVRPSASWMMAQVLAIRGQTAEAIEACRPSANAPNSEERWAAAQVAMTLASRNIGDAELLKKVEEILETTYRRDPQQIGLIVPLAMFRHIQGRFEEEVKLYREALVIHPGDTASLNNLAWALSEGCHRPLEALGPIEELISRIGRKAVALDTRGVILTRLDRSDEAIKDLEEALAAAPSSVGHFHLAVACRKAGRESEFRKNRDLALKAGLSPAQADPTERAEVASVLK